MKAALFLGLQLIGFVCVVAGFVVWLGAAAGLIVGGLGALAFGTLLEMSTDNDEGGSDGTRSSDTEV